MKDIWWSPWDKWGKWGNHVVVVFTLRQWPFHKGGTGPKKKTTNLKMKAIFMAKILFQMVMSSSLIHIPQ
jgi:hypothetical protein